MKKIILIVLIILIVILLLAPIQNSQVPEPTTIEVIVKTINGEPIKNAVVEVIDNDTVLCKDETNEYGGVLFILSNLKKTNLVLHIQHMVSVYKPIVVNISEDNHYDIILNESCDLNNDGIVIQDYNDLIFAYKCFLGIEKNCNEIGFQDWNNMKLEYQCFVGISSSEGKN